MAASRLFAALCFKRFSMLEKILREIELKYKNIFPNVFESLLPPSTDKQIFELKSELKIDSLPNDLTELLKWHNGQCDSCSFNQEDNFAFISIKEMIDAIRFFNNAETELISPWSDSWIPLFFNGSGDYRVYDLESGKIIQYYHDLIDRPILYKSLTSLCKDVLKSCTEEVLNEQLESEKSWMKVNLIIIKYPNGGLKAIKLIKETLKLPNGIGELNRMAKNHPAILIHGEYYMVIKNKLDKLKKTIVEDCFQIEFLEA